jgi:ABC-2 type transport system permease protein
VKSKAKQLSALVWINILLTLRDPLVLVVLLLTPLMMIATVGRMIGSQAGFVASPYDFAVPATSIFFMFFVTTALIHMVFRDVYWFTWPRVVCVSSRSLLVVAKFATGTAIGAGQLLLLWAISWPLFGFHGLSHPALLVLGIATAAVASSLGVALCSLRRSLEGTMQIANLVVFVFGLAGGTFVPFHYLPTAVQVVGVATPHYWSMIAIMSVMHGGGGVARSLLVLFLMALSYLVIGLHWLRFEHLARKG